MTSPTTSTSSIGGLASGMDTTSIVTQLMQIEAQPQTLLKSRLTTTQNDAAAYRDINTSFAALANAADALSQATAWNPTKATSSSSAVAATANAGAQPGSVTFSVDRLAAGHSVISDKTQKWSTQTTAFGLGTVTVTKAGSATPVTVNPTDSDGDGIVSLADAVTAINASGAGVTASAIDTGTGGFQLQLASTGTGSASSFTLGTTSGSVAFTVLNQAQDAQITLGNGGPTPTTITSGTNTFSGVLGGTSFTVNQTATSASITVASDPDAVAGKVKALVDAANAALTKISGYTDSSSGSKALLKGDYSLTSLSGRVLDAVSSAVGTSVVGANGQPVSSSAGSNGVQLTRDGKLAFDLTAFKTALAANPLLVKSIFTGTIAAGPDAVRNTPDDSVLVDGIGARLKALATQASDSATGMLTSLAGGQDSQVKDIQAQIDSWTTRLALRKQMLTAQFTAMETALGTLKNQSSWLTSQINSLPSNVKSN